MISIIVMRKRGWRPGRSPGVQGSGFRLPRQAVAVPTAGGSVGLGESHSDMAYNGVFCRVVCAIVAWCDLSCRDEETHHRYGCPFLFLSSIFLNRRICTSNILVTENELRLRMATNKMVLRKQPQGRLPVCRLELGHLRKSRGRPTNCVIRRQRPISIANLLRMLREV